MGDLLLIKEHKLSSMFIFSSGVIKQVAELNVGIMTQCIKSKTLDKIVKRGDMATVCNILQKVNAKLNGMNHQINLSGASTMYTQYIFTINQKIFADVFCNQLTDIDNLSFKTLFIDLNSMISLNNYKKFIFLFDLKEFK